MSIHSEGEHSIAETARDAAEAAGA